MKYDYNLLLPLYELQKVHVLRAIYLMADETTIRVLEKLYLGTSHQGYYWIYYDPLGKEGFFDYRQSRSRAGPNEILIPQCGMKVIFKAMAMWDMVTLTAEKQ